jgi:hypothetical protein
MQTCSFNVTPEMTCTDEADVVLNGEALCASHLHELYPAEVESGHADRLSGIVFLD